MLLEEDETDHKPSHNAILKQPTPPNILQPSPSKSNNSNNPLGKHILSVESKPFIVEFSPAAREG